MTNLDRDIGTNQVNHYMGLATGFDNPRKYQHIDVPGAGPQQRPRAVIDGGAGG